MGVGGGGGGGRGAEACLLGACSSNTNGDAPGIVVLGVDHLPAELARDATEYFSEQFVSYVKYLVCFACPP